MSSETEQRFQRRGQHVQTKLAGIATSIHIPTEGRQGWVMKMLVVLQKVVERLNELVKGGNTMEELSVGLENTETRRYFDECTKKFGINYDTVLDTTEEKDNFEEITKVVDEVFEEVKGMVQDTRIIQREEESRRLNRSRMVFEPTSSGVDPGGQMGPGAFRSGSQGGSASIAPLQQGSQFNKTNKSVGACFVNGMVIQQQKMPPTKPPKNGNPGQDPFGSLNAFNR